MTVNSFLAEGTVTLADAGMETYLIYREGVDLPDFASFTALERPEGRAALVRYYEQIIDVARRDHRPLLLATATWRASSDWGARLGYSASRLADANADAVGLLQQLRAAALDVAITIGGTLGPRGDAYARSSNLTQSAAADYHAPQVAALASAGAEFIAGMTLTDANEAAGIIDAARDQSLPVIASFTIDTDGRLEDGTDVASAIARTDALTDGYAERFLLNCAHPIHLARALESSAPEIERIRGVRVNASSHSHAELDAATTLDAGDPEDLARRCADLVARYPRLTVVGGCCGTDARHISAISSNLR